MGGIVVLLSLFAGVAPVLSQFSGPSFTSGSQFTEYGDYGRYFSGNTEESGEGDIQRDFPLHQPSFFMSLNNKNENSGTKESTTQVNSRSDSLSSTTVSSVTGSGVGYGGLTPPPPPQVTPSSDLQVNEDNRAKYYASERRAIVPSSLRELEESYIRSLSAGASPAKIRSSTKQPFLDPYGEDRKQTDTPGVENYSGFLMANRRYNENEHATRSISVGQSRSYFSHEDAQNAPVTYGFPLLNDQQHVPATANSIEAAFRRNSGGNGILRRKESGKFINFAQKNNIVPNFPDFSDRPPIPEEPESPPGTEDAIEQATRKPPATFLLPTPETFTGFGLVPPPLASPPSIFDPAFPEPVLERGFIPSFGPPTKHPLGKPLKETHPNLLLEHENNHLQLQSHHHLTTAQLKSNIPTTSAVPVLRPEFPIDDKDENDLPEEVSSVAPEPGDKPREGTVYKHISVHVPAEDLEEEISAPKVVKVAKNPEKHIKVIFIKPPDSRGPKTEVEISPNNPQKTLVYVLSESGGTRQPIRLVTPTPLKPAPPQVFFLRYTDGQTGAGHRSHTAIEEREHSPSGSGSTEQLPSARPIKQLAAKPHNPDAELLRSAPAPVLPTFSSFGHPNPSLAHLQSTLSSPTLYPITSNNFETTNDINDPTNSKFHAGTTAASAAPPALLPPNSNSHLAALRYNNANAFSPSNVQTQQSQLVNNNNNAYFVPPNYYSSLYHLYPPPALTSPPNQNLFPYFNNANIYQQQNLQSHPLQPQRFYHLGGSGQPLASSKLSGGTATETEQSSSIQGLYTVAPYLKNLPGSINFNSLIQNPDGNNLPRTTRNYAMMTYAPTYMPSASGSDHVPVFTSPAEFIKSLLGDSYMYYNNIANNSSFYSADFNHIEIPTSPTTSTTTTTPAPPVKASIQPQHHSFPVLYNLPSFQNFSQSPSPNPSHQPFTIVISNGGRTYEVGGNGIQFPYNGHPSLGTPINPHLMPSFLTTQRPPTTTSPQPRISWAPSTFPTALPLASPTPRQIINLPVIIYEGGTGKNTRIFPNRLTTGESVASHFNKLFNNFTKVEDGGNILNSNNTEQSSEFGSSQSESTSASEETISSEVREYNNPYGQPQSHSGEEAQPVNLQPSRSNYNSTIVFINNSNSNSTASPSSSRNRKRGKSRKRVNPAHVKPGRRLRKVRKPHKSKRKNGQHQEGHQPKPGTAS